MTFARIRRNVSKRVIRAVRFVTSSIGNHDGARMTVLPSTFLSSSNKEGTLQFFLKLDKGVTWESGGAARYANSTWWTTGNNWVIDGFNNQSSAYYNGSIGVVIRDGCITFLFGDGTPANNRTGDVHAIVGTIPVTHGEWVLVTVTFSNVSTASRLMSLFIGAVADGTETSTARTDMYETWWDDWNSFFVDEQGWVFGTEKQALNGDLQLPDFPGQIRDIRLYSRAKDAAEIATDVSESFSTTGLVAHLPCNETSGTQLSDIVGSSHATLVNASSQVWK